MSNRNLLWLAAVAFLIAFARSASVHAAAPKSPITVGQPAQWKLPGAPARVVGLGHATWGLSQAQLPDAVAADFGSAAAQGLRRDDGLDLAHRLTLTTTARWMTDVAPARLSFSFKNDRLVQVNVDWVIPSAATPAQRAALIHTAQTVTGNLYGSFWELFSMRRGARLGPDAVLVFGGEDPLGRGVEVSLFGVDTSPDGTRPPSGGSGARLRVTYAEDIFQRNIVRAGDF